MSSVTVKPKWWFRIMGWIARRLGWEIHLLTEHQDVHFLLQIFKVRRDK